MNSIVVQTLVLDNNGICNYCLRYDELSASLGTKEARQQWIQSKIEEIKSAGKGNPYDCILGVSGGLDSSYLAYWLKKKGLHPLLVHFDNGWDSELATENIKNICSKLEFPLTTFVVNWEEFKEIQLAYLRAGVIDIEAITDHAITSTLSKIASRNKIKYVISGFNFHTEAIMPRPWVWDKGDFDNIKDIYKKFGSGKRLRTFPHTNFISKIWQYWFTNRETIQVLNYIDYKKNEAKSTVMRELNWRDYGGKHYESIFTKFYQAYILPVKFGVDKRYAHYSNLICSGQLSREEALEELRRPLFSPEEFQIEQKYVCKKLGLSADALESFINGPIRKHSEFKTEANKWNTYFRLIEIFKLKRKSTKREKPS